MTPAPILATLEALPDAKRQRNGWTAVRCPSHEDKHASFAWRVRDDGSVGLACQAGCANEGIVSALGHELRDLFPPKDRQETHETRYEVRDAAGELVAVHVRLEPGKVIWWERPDGTRKLPEGKSQHDLPLYGSHRVGDFPPDSIIVIAEGEKATHALWVAKVPALGTFGAATTPTDLDVLRGRRVVLWPDHDAPGAAHMDRLAAALEGIAASVYRVRPPDSAPKGWDAADASHDVMTALIGEAVEKGPVAPVTDVTPELERSGRRVHQAGAFLRMDLPTQRWRVHELLPADGFAAIVGTDKEGKSLLALQAGLCIAKGHPLLGRDVEPATVLLIEEEGSAGAFQERLQTQAAALGVLHELDMLPLHVSIRQRWRLDSDEDVREIEAQSEAIGASVILIGPLSQLASIDENSNKDMNAVTRRLLDMLARRGGLVVLTHHRRKVGEDQPRTVREFFDSTRGGNALMAAVDAAVGVRRDPEASDGIIYVMLRDGPAQRIHVAFDTTQLLVHPTEAPIRQKAPHDDVYKVVADADGPVNRNYVAAKLGVSPHTARDRLEVLVADGRLVPSEGARRELVYSIRRDPAPGHPPKRGDAPAGLPQVTRQDPANAVLPGHPSVNGVAA